MLRFSCDQCGQKLRVADPEKRVSVTCPKCGHEISLVGLSENPLTADSDLAIQNSPRENPLLESSLDENQLENPEDHPEPPEQPLSKVRFSVDHEDLIDMTAMVDIVFFLLIYFLVTSFQGLDSAIPMPKVDAQQAEGASAQASEPSTLDEFEEDDEYIVVHIDEDDQIDVEGTEVFGLSELRRKIGELRDSVPHPDKLMVVGHGNASHGVMVSVLDIGHDAQLKRVRMIVTDVVED